MKRPKIKSPELKTRNTPMVFISNSPSQDRFLPIKQDRVELETKNGLNFIVICSEIYDTKYIGEVVKMPGEPIKDVNNNKIELIDGDKIYFKEKNIMCLSDPNGKKNS